MQILKKTNLKAYEKAHNIGFKRVIELIKEKQVKGRGGAGFPTGDKWEMVAKTELGERYVICNADEGEPGTFKDKFIIENNPEILIEGILIAAYAVGAEQCYIYLRGEYDYLKSKLEKVIKNILDKTKANTKIDIVLGAGAYVCGDETAILSSIEGNRGQPRTKPPYPVTKGLFGKPTVINNVETLANVSLALLYDDYNPNLRLYSVSGNVSKPGVYELPLGTRLCDVIDKAEPKNKVKAVYFGCFGGCLPHCEIELTPENICGKECMLGACTIIVVDEKHSIVDMATNISKFYEFESCGKCTPCREGTMRILAILQNISLGKAKLEDLNTLQDLCEVIKETSFCGLGQTSVQHLITGLRYFRKEFEAKCKRN
jgi:NADH:ubiquinone oxidoreductase subunit F (NADH-binding)